MVAMKEGTSIGHAFVILCKGDRINADISQNLYTIHCL